MIIYVVMSWLVLLIGIGIVIALIASPHIDWINKVFFSLIVTVASIFLSLLVGGASSLTTQYKDIETTRVPPTFIIKTNNAVVVYLISKSGIVLHSMVTTDAVYWNLTNIIVEISEGNNIYGGRVQDVCKVVAR